MSCPEDVVNAGLAYKVNFVSLPKQLILQVSCGTAVMKMRVLLNRLEL